MEGNVTEEQIAEVEERVSSLVDRAIDEARAAPYPDPEAAVATEFCS